MQKYYTQLKSPVCDLILVGDKRGLSNIYFQKDLSTLDTSWENNDIFFQKTLQQLIEYFEKKREKFSIKLNPSGTKFQQKVWNELQNIPYGKTTFYQDIAQKINNPKAMRAVGNANNKNPIPIIIPCHRVIGKNGSLVGYAGGISIKEKLLLLEKAQ